MYHKESSGEGEKSIVSNLESILPNFFLHKTKIFSIFFATKLGRFIAKGFFSYVTHTQT